MNWLSVFEPHGTIDVLGIGNFDGVHLGHQGVLAHARRVADGGRVAVLVPDPHPAAVLSRAPALLTDMSERARWLERHGADVLLRLPFNEGVAGMEPDAFVEHVVVDAVSPGSVVVGFNFTFGRGARAGARELQGLLSARGIGFEEAPAVIVDGAPVSSSRIRASLGEGRVEDAMRLLGRPYTLRGEVRPGQGRGRTIGFPTANVHLRRDLALPADGVYAVTCAVGEDAVLGVANLGSRPTFDEAQRLLEVHLFGIQGDLYGSEMQVGFVARIRGQMRFSSPAELSRQITLDSLRAKEMLGVAGA